MKKKDNIQPPSKKAASSSQEEEIVLLEEQLKVVGAEYTHVLSNYTQAKNELIAAKQFDRTLNLASKELGVNKRKLREAFNDNKYELTHGFKLAQQYNSASKASMGFTSIMFACFSASIYAGLASSEPFPLLCSLLPGFMMMIGAKELVQERSKSRLHKEKIAQKIIDYKQNAQLPPPK